jgi:hypothetical protein
LIAGIAQAFSAASDYFLLNFDSSLALLHQGRAPFFFAPSFAFQWATNYFQGADADDLGFAPFPNMNPALPYPIYDPGSAFTLSINANSRVKDGAAEVLNWILSSRFVLDISHAWPGYWSIPLKSFPRDPTATGLVRTYYQSMADITRCRAKRRLRLQRRCLSARRHQRAARGGSRGGMARSGATGSDAAAGGAASMPARGSGARCYRTFPHRISEVPRVKKIIIDTDPGIDDAVAIMFALGSRHFDLKAITTVSGNLTADRCSVNARKVLELLDVHHVPVARGMQKPLVRPYPKDPFSHGDNGLGNLELPEPFTAGGPSFCPGPDCRHRQRACG